MNNNMLCPFCMRKLRKGKKRNFETLLEHVSDPNGEYGDPGARQTWECICDCSINAEAYWDDSGDLYVGNFFRLPFIYHSAINSIARKIDIIVNLGKLKYL